MIIVVQCGNKNNCQKLSLALAKKNVLAKNTVKNNIGAGPGPGVKLFFKKDLMMLLLLLLLILPLF